MIATNELPQVTLIEAAKLLNVTHKTVTRWAKSGRLQAVKIGGRYRTTEKWILAMQRPAADIAPVVDQTHGSRIDPEEAFRQLEARFGITKHKLHGPRLR